MLIQCRATTPKLSAQREPHAKVGKFQSPDFGRMRPAMTDAADQASWITATGAFSD
jgi:hypothetical protein